MTVSTVLHSKHPSHRSEEVLVHSDAEANLVRARLGSFGSAPMDTTMQQKEPHCLRRDWPKHIVDLQAALDLFLLVHMMKDQLK